MVTVWVVDYVLYVESNGHSAIRSTLGNILSLTHCE